MADNLFMSDYQKIIFANNINENNIKDLGGYGNGKSINDIISLSTAYPFVVFVTDCKNGAINDRITYTNLPDKGVSNIWVNGLRATKFVGVDPNSSITIGDRTIKLHFDYDTGLLSFKDANELKSIKLIGYKYNKANQYTYTAGSILNGSTQFISYNYNNITSINSVDNKFKLIFEFEVEEGTNIDSISKGLNINSINTTDRHFNIISGPKHVTDRPEYTNTSTKKCYEYECQIVWDTERMPNNYSYNAISQYDNTIKFPSSNGFGLNLRLNPVNYDIILRETGTKVINNITLKANKEYIFDVNIYPNENSENVYTYPISDYYKSLNEQKKLLDFIVESTNSNYVEVVNNASIPVSNHTLNFKLKTKNAINNIVSINLKLQNNSRTDDFTYNLIKSFNINLGGGTVYFYCGYDVPENTDTFKSKMHDITNNISNIDLNPLYDWKSNNWGVTDNTTKYFYIAFTSGYENIICSCWDCYINNGSYKKYIPIGTDENGIIKNDNNNNGRFIRQTNVSGLSVYKSSITGKFFGKIQIQNN